MGYVTGNLTSCVAAVKMEGVGGASTRCGKQKGDGYIGGDSSMYIFGGYIYKIEFQNVLAHDSPKIVWVPESQNAKAWPLHPSLVQDSRNRLICCNADVEGFQLRLHVLHAKHPKL